MSGLVCIAVFQAGPRLGRLIGERGWLLVRGSVMHHPQGQGFADAGPRARPHASAGDRPSCNHARSRSHPLSWRGRDSRRRSVLPAGVTPCRSVRSARSQPALRSLPRSPPRPAEHRAVAQDHDDVGPDLLAIIVPPFDPQALLEKPERSSSIVAFSSALAVQLVLQIAGCGHGPPGRGRTAWRRSPGWPA